MNRGYAGYYKEFYLRSSYEYAYAVYLDYMSIPWSFEDRVFDIEGRSYKPDFFFYNQSGELSKIVEIKSRNKKAKESASRKLLYIEQRYKIETELISYEELFNFYVEMPVSLNSVITHWIKAESTTISKAAKGILNPHYGLKHTDKTKKQIGANTKMLWNGDSDAKKRMIEGLRKSGLAQKGKIRVPREKRYCQLCLNEFVIIKTSSRIYCSRACSGKVAIRLATDVYVQERKSIHSEMKKFIIQWTMTHQKLVLSTPFNKINSTLKPMIDEIHNRFGVKDLRVISKAVFGKDCGRKELLRFMKKLCSENIC